MTIRALWLAPSVAIAFAVFPAAQAQEDSDGNRGTLEQQLACTPDVFRLCGGDIPDVNRIVACLRRNGDQLGAACKAVFAAKDDSSQDTARPARSAGSLGGRH